MAPKRESPLLLKSYETLVWLLRHTQKFPKSQRFVLAKRMEEAGLDFHDAIVDASRRRDPRRRLARLAEADLHLERLKVYNRLAHDLRLHTGEQYAHLGGRLDEQGRLLGGWLRSLTGSGGGPPPPGGAPGGGPRDPRRVLEQ
jgi:hypothetical protein